MTTPDSHEAASALPEPAPPENREIAEGPPPGTKLMAKLRWLLVVLMAGIAALSVAYSLGIVSGNSASAAETQYYCPMHPQVVQDHPGECPICSMSLVLRSSQGASGTQPKASKPPAGGHAGHDHATAGAYFCPMHPEQISDDPNDRCPICGMKLEKRVAPNQAPATAGSPPIPTAVPGLVPVELALDRTQLIGVRTAKAARERLVSEIRATGVIAADESKLARVHARFSGWIEGLSASTAGQKVRAGQHLASIFNLELLPAQQEYLTARRWNAAPSTPALSTSAQPALPEAPASALEEDARSRLRLLGMSSAEIDQVAKSGKPNRTVSVSAPIGGYVTRRSAVRGMFVEPGTELFEIADLSKVWVLADVYEYEMARVAVGQAAELELTAYPGERFSGKVDLVYPVVDSNTRTLRLRVVLDNKAMKLRPGMYGDLLLQLGEAQGVVIPTEALVDTGEYQYVFLAQEGGRFEPRRVRAGARAQGKVQILEGLSEGDTVVSTANFLIDSESRLRAAIEGSSSQAEASP